MKANKKIMILGGYGTFGSRIAAKLCQYNYTIIIAGRNKSKAQKLILKLKKTSSNSQIEIAIFDAHKGLNKAIHQHQPTLIIHTCGPFQGQSTTIAETCIQNKVHYIDLADGRDFVNEMNKLDSLAKSNGVIAITAASTVPTLSSAVLQHYIDSGEFSKFSTVKYGITPGQKTERGLATTKAVLSYIGKPIKSPKGENKTRFGWQDTYKQNYPIIGKRLMGNCEIPDIDLLQAYFPIDNLQFSAGMESMLFHRIIWLISWLVRLKLPLNLPKHAKLLLKVGRMFDFLGGHDGGMHVQMNGLDKNANKISKTWYLIAEDGDGPMVPTIPAIIMAQKIMNQEVTQVGVKPCIGMVTLKEYLKELEQFTVKVFY